MPASANCTVTRTARDSGERLAALPSLAWAPAPPTKEPALSITVDPARSFQTIEGFGGAFTESAAVTLHTLPREQQEEVLRAYFDPVYGHGYNLCRTHINSCDFSVGNYASADQPDDFELRHFNLDRDHQDIIPMILAARRLAGPELKLFSSPWSPPAWMKTNGQMNLGGKLRPECREVWARHYCRYIAEMAKVGAPIWGVTVQNEPAATQRWDSCIYTADEERDFVRDYLGPALHAAGLESVKVIVWDHNRNLLYERVQPIYNDPVASRYVWGAGIHWYSGDNFDNAQAVHERWPDKAILFTEGCQEGGPHPGAWGLGERYARSMIADLNRWTVGWVDWNLLLDDKGGPNHVGNFCSAPILVGPATGKILYQSSYYYVGHFSRFIKRGARRIICVATRDEVETIAFQNPDRSIAVIVLNRTETTLPLVLRHEGLAVSGICPARSITTYGFTP